jgi:hypothetical protein
MQFMSLLDETMYSKTQMKMQRLISMQEDIVIIANFWQILAKSKKEPKSEV